MSAFDFAFGPWLRTVEALEEIGGIVLAFQSQGEVLPFSRSESSVQASRAELRDAAESAPALKQAA